MGSNFWESLSYGSRLEERQPSAVPNHAYRRVLESDFWVPKEMSLWATSDEIVLLKFAVSHLACIDYA